MKIVPVHVYSDVDSAIATVTKLCMPNLSTTLANLSSSLPAALKRLPQQRSVVGFDAFIDDILHVVGERQTPDAYQQMSEMTDYGAWISGSSGRSGLIEVVRRTQAAGGCAVNLSDGMTNLGAHVDAFVGVGTPTHEVFTEFSGKCSSVQSIGMEPGYTIVQEFHDGKIMLCRTSQFAAYTAAFMREQLAKTDFVARCEQAQVLAFTNWTLYPHMSACWKMLRDDLLKSLSHRPRIFFDLVDPKSRSIDDLRGALHTLASFEHIGAVTLSLNGNETQQVARALDIDDQQDMPLLAQHIREALGIDEYVVHLIKSACCATGDGVMELSAPYCAQPKQSVGAGDRFNAGYVCGHLLDLPAAERLSLANGVAGFFVRNARSGTSKELCEFYELLEKNLNELS